MDNFKFDMTSEGKERFKIALSLVHKNKVIGYRVHKEKGLMLYHVKVDASKDMILFPYEMTIGQASEFAYGWIENYNLGNQPDHDGDNGRGWRVYTESWGKVNGEWQCFVAIQAVWAMYGK